jgi:hypothetical protein
MKCTARGLRHGHHNFQRPEERRTHATTISVANPRPHLMPSERMGVLGRNYLLLDLIYEWLRFKSVSDGN